MFQKLCSWKFYIEELSEIYSRQFKRLLSIFLIVQSPPKLMAETLRSASCIITFDSLYTALLELDCVKIKAFLSLWINSKIPNNCIESSIMASFPENDIINFLTDKCEKMTLSENCKIILKEKSECAKFDTNIWKSFIDTESDQFDSKLKSASSNKPDYEEILANIESNSPTDIAFGMYCLRQRISENSNSKIDLKLLNSVISCLFHEERYNSFSNCRIHFFSFVYMNSIKTCVYIGKIDASFVCDILLKTAKLRINTENILIMLRFVEIFDCLLIDLKCSTSLSPWTELFSRHCAIFVSSDCFELKCSIINYYINIIVYDYSAFIRNQTELWGSFNLHSKAVSHSDLETEGNFSI